MAGSVSSHGAQRFTAPNYGIVAFDQVGALHDTRLLTGNQYLEVNQAGLYQIDYAAMATTGMPAYATITFLPGGTDQSGKIPLSANVLVSGTIVRRMGAGTRVSLRVDSGDGNTPVTLPATDQYCNAFLSVTRVGPYPSGIV